MKLNMFTATLAALCCAVAAVHAAHAQTSGPAVKPSIVLVHGAYADGSSWGAAVSVAAFASGAAVNALGGTNAAGRAETTCGDRLRQAMDDMHHAMHAVPPAGDVDEDFVRLMLPHHQAAVEMAKVELLCGKDEVNRRLAQEIIADQQSEIELMRLWLSKRDQQGRAQPSGKAARKP